MQPDVELRVPIDTAYVAVLRMTTAGIAARLDFTLDDIEDLRIAVGEACALVLEGADPDGSLRATYHVGKGELRVTVTADTIARAESDGETFAWQVLNALAAQVESTVSETEHTISLTVTSGVLA